MDRVKDSSYTHYVTNSFYLLHDSKQKTLYSCYVFLFTVYESVIMKKNV